MSDLSIIALVCALYFAVVLAIGVVASRHTTTDAEDYFLGGRQARTLVLFMALFGTNVTPFVLLGVPGRTATFAAERAADDGDAPRR